MVNDAVLNTPIHMGEIENAPDAADAFAHAVIAVICHAGVTAAVGHRTYERCLRALSFGATVRLGFRHPGKADAIDLIWRERKRLYLEYVASTDKLSYLATLPWIGPVTRHVLAWRLGLTDGPCERERRAVA